MKRVIKYAGLIFAAVLMAALSGCDDATIAKNNIATAADNFEIQRRIVFYNGITDKYIFVVEGACSLDLDRARLMTVICKTAGGNGAGSYKRHYLGLSDNVTYFAEQLDGANVSAYHYRVIFKPEAILPEVEVK